MTRIEVKEILNILILFIFNILISFIITNTFKISGIIILKSYTLMYGDITSELIIFIWFAVLEVIILNINKI